MAKESFVGPWAKDKLERLGKYLTGSDKTYAASGFSSWRMR
jgi:hypothetical protein